MYGPTCSELTPSDICSLLFRHEFHFCSVADIGHNAGLLQKVWHDNLSYRQAYEWAVTKFRNEHEDIRNQYLAH